MRLVVDIETDSLEVDQVKNIWCIVAKDIDTNIIYQFEGLTDACKELLSSADNIIGHNFLAYDYCVIDRYARGLIDPKGVVDTLVLSKLLKYTLDDGEGHSLEAWGNRFNLPKLPSPDFGKYSTEMMTYCIRDVEVNTELYRYLMRYMPSPQWDMAIETEMAMAWICLDMHLNGFRYDKDKADKLRVRLDNRLGELDTEISNSITPTIHPLREYNPRLTKHGTISRQSVPRSWTDLTRVHPGCPFCTFEYVEFNPNSTKQLIDFLNKAGWQPTERTKTGKGYKISEKNLVSLPENAPEAARKLVERLLISSRTRTLKEWEASYRSNTARIHGTYNSIGTWPGRMSHQKPNLGNVAARKSIKYKGEYLKKLATDLGEEMRNLWICDQDSWLVGTDMEAAHVRLFAHYIDDKAFTEAVISGDKKKGTDVHTLGAKIFAHLGCDRDNHKTFIFSFFNGAGPPKVAEIFGCSLGEGAEALRLYQQRYPGLAELRSELIPSYAAQGWFPGLDGRQVIYNQEHGMFAGMLQSGEAIVMKMANIIWRRKLNETGINYKQVNLVHDEYVTEVRGTEKDARLVGQVQCESIGAVGRILGLRCPLAGESKIGKTWLEVH